MLKPVNNYMANVGKSLILSARDVAKEDLTPNIAEFASTNKDFFNNAYGFLRNPKQQIRKQIDAFKESKVFKAIDYGAKNLVEDLRSGDFYAAEREDRDSMELGMGMTMDDFNDLSEFDVDSDSMSDLGKKKKKDISDGDLKIASTVEKTSAASTHATVNAIIATNDASIKNSRAISGMMYEQNERLFGGLHNDLSILNATMDSMHKIQSASINNIDQNSAAYFTDSLKLDTERNALLKELVEMQRNQYKSAVDKENEEKKNKKKIRWGDIQSGGMVNFEDYSELIGQNVKNLIGSLGMFEMNEDSNFLAAMMSTPLRDMTKSIMKGIVPATIKLATQEIDNTLSNVFATLVAKMNNESEKGGILGTLNKVFGVNLSVNRSIDSGKYFKGPVPFDGLTRKAIIDVIPTYLRRIEAAITGRQENVFDFENGRWTTVQEVKKRYEDIKKNAINSGTRDLRAKMNPMAKKVIASGTISDKEGFEKALEEFYTYLYENNGDFNPKKSADKNGIDRATYANLDKYYKQIVTIFENFDYDAVSKHHTQSSLKMNSKAVLDAKNTEHNQYRAIENAIASVYNSALNSPQGEAGGKWKKDDKTGKDVFHATGALLEVRDKYKNTVFDYLNAMTKELVWQRTTGFNNLTDVLLFAGPGGGYGGGGYGGGGYNGGGGGKKNRNRNNNRRFQRELEEMRNRINGSYADSTLKDYRNKEEVNKNTNETDRRRREEEELNRKAIEKIKDGKAIDLRDFTVDEQKALLRLTTLVQTNATDNYNKSINEAIDDNSVAQFLDRNIYKNRVKSMDELNKLIEKAESENKNTDEVDLDLEDTQEEDFFKSIEKGFKKLKNMTADMLAAPTQAFTNVLYTADRAIYEMFFKQKIKNDDDDDEDNDEDVEEYDGFLEMLAGKTKAKFKSLGESFKKDIIEPFKKKLGIDDENEFAEKFKGSLGEMANTMFKKFLEANKDVYTPLYNSTIAPALGLKPIGATDGLKSQKRQIQRNKIMEDMRVVEGANNMADERLLEVLRNLGINVADHDNLKSLKKEAYGLLDKKIYDNTDFKKDDLSGIIKYLARHAKKTKDPMGALQEIAAAKGIILDGENVKELASNLKSQVRHQHDLKVGRGENAGILKYTRDRRLTGMYNGGNIFDVVGHNASIDDQKAYLKSMGISDNLLSKLTTQASINRLYQKKFGHKANLNDILDSEGFSGTIEEKKLILKRLGVSDKDLANLKTEEDVNKKYTRLQIRNGNAYGTFKSKPFVGNTMLSKGELLFNDSGVSMVGATGAYHVSKPTHIMSSYDSYPLTSALGLNNGPRKTPSQDLAEENKVKKSISGKFANHNDGTIDIKNGNVTLDDIKENAMKYLPEGAAGGVAGGVLSLLLGTVGGPLLGAAVGAGASIIKNSDTLKDKLFGTVGEDGTRKGGSLLNKEIMKSLNKYMPDMTKYGLAGILPGLFTGLGPIGGLLIGGAFGYLKNNEKFTSKYFGDNGLLKVNDKTKSTIEKLMPGATKGAVAGAIATIFGGPFGLLGNAALGAGIGMMTTTDEFKEMIFGKEINGEKFGGLVQGFKDTLEPLTELAVNMKDKLIDFIDNDIVDPLKQAIAPLVARIPRVLGFLPRLINNHFEKVFGRDIPTLLKGAIVQPFTNAVSKLFDGGMKLAHIINPLNAVGKLGKFMRKRDIDRGRADYMTATERVEFNQENGRESSELDTALASVEGGENLGATERGIKALEAALYDEHQLNRRRKNAKKDINNIIRKFTGDKGKHINSKTQKKMYDILTHRLLTSKQDINTLGKDELEAITMELTNDMKNLTGGAHLNDEELRQFLTGEGGLFEAVRKYKRADTTYKDVISGTKSKDEATAEAYKIAEAYGLGKNPKDLKYLLNSLQQSYDIGKRNGPVVKAQEGDPEFELQAQSTGYLKSAVDILEEIKNNTRAQMEYKTGHMEEVDAALAEDKERATHRLESAIFKREAIRAKYMGISHDEYDELKADPNNKDAFNNIERLSNTKHSNVIFNPSGKHTFKGKKYALAKAIGKGHISLEDAKYVTNSNVISRINKIIRQYNASLTTDATALLNEYASDANKTKMENVEQALRSIPKEILDGRKLVDKDIKLLEEIGGSRHKQKEFRNKCKMIIDANIKHWDYKTLAGLRNYDPVKLERIYKYNKVMGGVSPISGSDGIEEDTEETTIRDMKSDEEQPEPEADTENNAFGTIKLANNSWGTMLAGIGKGALSLGKGAFSAVKGLFSKDKDQSNVMEDSANAKANLAAAQQAFENMTNGNATNYAMNVGQNAAANNNNLSDVDKSGDGISVVIDQETMKGTKYKINPDGSIDPLTSDPATKMVMMMKEKKEAALNKFHEIQNSAMTKLKDFFVPEDESKLKWWEVLLTGAVAAPFLSKVFKNFVKPFVDEHILPIWEDKIKPGISNFWNNTLVPFFRDDLPTYVENAVSAVVNTFVEHIPKIISDFIKDIPNKLKLVVDIAGKTLDLTLGGDDGTPTVTSKADLNGNVTFYDKDGNVIKGSDIKKGEKYYNENGDLVEYDGENITVSNNSPAGSYYAKKAGNTMLHAGINAASGATIANKGLHALNTASSKLLKKKNIMAKAVGFVGKAASMPGLAAESLVLNGKNIASKGFYRGFLQDRIKNAAEKADDKSLELLNKFDDFAIDASNLGLREAMANTKAGRAMSKVTGFTNRVSNRIKSSKLYGVKESALHALKDEFANTKAGQALADSKVGKFVTNAKDKITNSKVVKAATFGKDLASSLATKAKNGLKNSKIGKAVADDSKGIGKLISYCKQALDAILGHKKVSAKLTELVKFLKIDNLAKWLATFKDKVVKIFTQALKKGAKAGTKLAGTGIKKALGSAAKFISGFGWIIALVYDFLTGCDEAESILEVSETSVLEEVACGITKALCNLLVVPSIVPGTHWIASKIVGLFDKNLEERQKAAEEEVEKYNKENGTNYTVSEYMDINKSFTGKVKHTVKTAVKKVKTGVGKIVKKAKGAVTTLKDKALDVLGEGFFSNIGSIVKAAVTGDFKTYATAGGKGDEGGEENEATGVSKLLLGTTRLSLLPIVGVTTLIKTVFKGIKGAISTVTDIAPDLAKVAAMAFTGKVSEVASFTPNVSDPDSFGGKVHNTVIGLGKFFGLPIALATNFIGSIFKKIKGTLSDVKSGSGTGIKDLFKYAVTGQLGKFYTYGDDKKKEGFAGGINGVVLGLGKIILTGVALPSALFSFIHKKIKAMVETTDGGEGVGVDDMFKAAVAGNPAGVKDAVPKVDTSTFGGKVNGAFVFLSRLIATPLAYINKFVNKVVDWVGNIADWVKDKFSNITDFFADPVNYMYNLLTKDSGTGAEVDAKAIGGTLGNTLKSGLKDVVDKNSSGSGKGKGSNKQIDPAIANIRFNAPGDTSYQTIGDSGCGPAAAVTAMQSVYGKGSNEVVKAAKFALNNGYKEKDGGTTPNFFGDYFAKNGLQSQTTTDRNTLKQNIMNGQPTVLMGKDKNGVSSSTPYGTNPHYVTATGMDGRGNVIIQDPESRYDNQLYNIDDVLNKTSIGVSTYGKGSTRAIRNPYLRTVRTYFNTQYHDMKPNRYKYGKGKDYSAQVWYFLKKQGCTDEAAAGIMGNLQQESGMDPTRIQDSQHGAGICQWEDYGAKSKRWLNLSNYAKKKGTDWTDLATQLEFLWKELKALDYYFKKNTPITNYKELISLTDYKKACLYFEQAFERAGTPAMENRYKYAQQFLSKYAGKTGDELQYDQGTSSVESDASSSSSTSSGTDGIFAQIQSIADNSGVSKMYDALFGSVSSATDSSSTSSTDDSSSSSSSGVSGSAMALVEAAKKDVGNVAEKNGNNDTKINRWYGDWAVGQPWCAMAVSYWADQAGISQDVIPKYAECNTGYNWFKQNGVTVNKPKDGQPGDIVFFDKGSGSKYHTGIVEDVSNGEVHTIEGNHGNKVARGTYSVDSGKLFLMRPKYANTSTTTSTTDSSQFVSMTGDFSAVGGNRNKPLAKYGTFKESMYGTGKRNVPKPRMLEFTDPSAGKVAFEDASTIKTGMGKSNKKKKKSYSSESDLINTVIEILSKIADNTDKLETIASILSEKLGVEISSSDLSNKTTGKSTTKQKLKKALKSNTTSGSGKNSKANKVDTERLNTIISSMNAIASE